MRRILVSILLTTALSACANVSRFSKDSLVAHGEQLDGSQVSLYYTIRIDLQHPGDSSVLRALVKLSADSPPVAIGQLRPELASRYLPLFTPPPHWPVAWKERTKEEKIYTGHGFQLRFKEDQLLSIGICSHCAGGRENPLVGTPDGQNYYILPLTAEQMTEVFGPPDQIYKVHEVQY